MIATDAVFLLTAAVIYALTAGFILEHARKRKLSVLYTFSVYFISLSLYFILSGANIYVDNPLVLIASLVVLTFAAATLTHFPFQLELPKASKIIRIAVFTIALGAIIYSLVALTLPIARNISLIYAAAAPILVSIYMITAGMHTPNIRGKSISLGILSLFSSLPFVGMLFFSGLTIPVFGIVAGISLVFALISTVSLVFALYVNKYIQ